MKILVTIINIIVMDTDVRPVYHEMNASMNEDNPIIVGKHVWIGCRPMFFIKGTYIVYNYNFDAASFLNKWNILNKL